MPVRTAVPVRVALDVGAGTTRVRVGVTLALRVAVAVLLRDAVGVGGRGVAVGVRVGVAAGTVAGAMTNSVIDATGNVVVNPRRVHCLIRQPDDGRQVGGAVAVGDGGGRRREPAQCDRAGLRRRAPLLTTSTVSAPSPLRWAA